ncbi:MAG: SGNH/GDSL hydrolase family protein [Chitinophagales bacterium]|nr:SGNH/GDSL hydrolase family protein [Chitinophagales bacterium]OJV28351.1 MAG: hypothetical protein BGO32_05840 [Bacteroidetes bacterium 37-13]HRN93390.1 hypothetical protein [Chitinophagales bacterium]HRP38658.1 hypothetical protein [Chitinophagales bacterium]
MKTPSLLKWFSTQVLFIVAILLTAEVALRYTGTEPGNIQPTWSNFKTVDTLIEIPYFISNSNGILVANSKFNSNINNWGFRFDKTKLNEPNKKKIMLIGDSFTWGLSATPLDSCFADLLNKNEALNVLNFGIPVADPVQYAAIAKTYLDSVKPENVVVVFYTGNDVMLCDRNIEQKPFYYYTNAGALLAADGNKFLPSAKAAYNYYAIEKFRIKKPKNNIESIAIKSALATRLLSIWQQYKSKIEKENAIKTLGISKKYLKEIKQLCQEKNIKFTIAVIPEYKELAFYRKPFKTKYHGLFQDNELGKFCFVPNNLNSKMYNPYPDAHFNNAGHRAYADFLQKILLQQ